MELAKEQTTVVRLDCVSSGTSELRLRNPALRGLHVGRTDNVDIREFGFQKTNKIPQTIENPITMNNPAFIADHIYKPRPKSAAL